MQALGLIETRGLLPAIESADVMLKTAQVELVEKALVGGGLVTITVTGDVGAVKAAVEAAVTAVQILNPLSLIAHHVIPRPHPEVAGMVEGEKPEPEPPQEPLASKEPELETTAMIEDSQESAAAIPVKLKQPCKGELDALVQEFGLRQAMEALKQLSVVKLRNLAREYKDLGIAGRAISKANKESLLQKLEGYYQRQNKE